MGCFGSNTKAIDQIRSEMATLRNEQSKMTQQSQLTCYQHENKHDREGLEATFDENVIVVSKAEINKNVYIEQRPKAHNSKKYN